MNKHEFIELMVMVNELMQELKISGKDMETVMYINDGDLFASVNYLNDLAATMKSVD